MPRQKNGIKRPIPIARKDIVKENLPYSYVYYPNTYGAFLAFQKTKHSPPYLCLCAKTAVNNYIKLRTMEKIGEYADSLRMAPIDNYYFPDYFAKKSLKAKKNPIEFIRFKKKLCHRCNLVPPKLRYCLEMYGVKFKQRYGWYINQTFFRMGLHPQSFRYLDIECPTEIKILANKAIRSKNAFIKEYKRILEIVYGPPRQDILDDEITFWTNVKCGEEKKMEFLQKKSRIATRELTKKIENIIREELGFRKVGEGWISETILYQIVKKIFMGRKVVFHYRPNWLEGLELDIYVKAERIAFEYQGQQHFHAVHMWGGQQALRLTQYRDKRKQEICKEKRVKLIAVDYTEPLTEEYIRGLLS